jgi:hypothetical protein
LQSPYPAQRSRLFRQRILQIQGFGALPGIAIVVACVAVNQIAYLAGVILSPSQLVQKQIWQKTKTEAQYTACNPHHQQRVPS